MNIFSKEDLFDFNQLDENGLTDIHKIENRMGIAIDKVGINRFRVPVQYRYKDGSIRGHDAEASLYIHCPPGKSGINMSRLCEILTQELSQDSVSVALFKKTLGRLRREMRDHEDEPLFEDSYFKLRFKVALKQPSLKSENWGWQYYDCEMEGRENREGKVRMFLTLHYEYGSTCPCSLSMAKQYEQEYARGLTEEGNGIASPHSQRSRARVTVEYDPSRDFFIEELVAIMRHAVPTETQSLVKRMDEQAFAILSGKNPIFVEHAARRFCHALNAEPRILDWVVSIEHWESLHSHNASAVIRKGRAGGLL
ncbi:MAG: GTP cyclohydrolase FolE2 [Candidatus Omnitrophota bacterium]